MRRRSPINVWPSLADLMTILAVPALFTAVGVLPFLGLNGSGERQVQQDFVETTPKPGRKQEAFGVNLEHVKNKKMFWAIQRFHRMLGSVKKSVGGQLGPAQTIVFGDDLLTYDLGETRKLKWKPEGLDKLRKFCASLQEAFEKSDLSSAYRQPGEVFLIHIEGHADSIGCRDVVGDPLCNWRISSARAANFVDRMKDPKYCPGGDKLFLLPIGYADSAPMSGSKPTRRIALRIVPNYDRLIRTRHPVLMKYYGRAVGS